MQCRGAVFLEPGSGAQVRTLTLDAPEAGEVLVRIYASGVCHTDYSLLTGVLPFSGPTVLGHEGAGVVEAVGPGVATLSAGDHVILSWMPFCGLCAYCLQGQYSQCDTIRTARASVRRFHLDGQDLSAFASVASMSEYSVVPELGAIKIPRDIPLDKAALIGCGVQTGVGAAINTAAVRTGSTCAVWGAGGVGLNIIQGCRLAGATRIIAVDASPAKLGFAKQMGATDVVDASAVEPVAAVVELTGGRGPDYTFEAIGLAKTIEQAYNAVRRGGTCTVVGVGPFTETFSLSTGLFAVTEKVLRGSFYGGGATPRDFPRLLDWYRQGRLQLDSLITKTYTLDEVGEAFDDLVAGRNARGVILHRG